MRILVAGCVGFLGSNISKYYVEQGYEVLGIDNLTKHELIKTGYKVNASRNYIWNLLKSVGVELKQLDIRNKKGILSLKDIDYIVNCAAQPAMTISIENPSLDISVNVMGTFNLLELARKLDIPILLFSTIHVYGTGINQDLIEQSTRYIKAPIDIDENYPILDTVLTPLHASKRSMEIYGQTYIDTYGLKVGIFRATGMYGPNQFGGEDHGWVANFCIRNLMKYPIRIFGSGKQVRVILYVSDVDEAIHAFYKYQIPGIYNIGGGEETMISLIECIKLIEEITSIKSKVKNEKERFGDLRYFVCDISKASKYLHWSPTIKPKEGIRRLIDWIEENKELFS